MSIDKMSGSGGASGKEPACQCRDLRVTGSIPGSERFPQRRTWQPTPVFLPGESHGQRSSLASYSPWGHKESDGTEATEHPHTPDTYLHMMEDHPAIKKNEMMPFATTWMKSQIIILSDVSKTEKDKYHTISFICGI